MAYFNMTSLKSHVTSFAGEAGPDYKLHRCVPLLGQGRALYITRPFSVESSCPSRKRAIVGVYEQHHGVLKSDVKIPLAQVSPVCGIAPWREGIVMCGPEGITYTNAVSFVVTQLLSVEIGNFGFKCLSDIAVLGLDSTIWFLDTDYNFHDATASKIYCFDPLTGRLRVTATNIEVPVNLAFSSDSSKCYVSDVGSGSIMVYDVVAANVGYTLANRARFVYLDSGITCSLKTDEFGMVYAASGNRIACWDRYGVLRGTMELAYPVTDFFVRDQLITVVHDNSIVQAGFVHLELDARL